MTDTWAAKVLEGVPVAYFNTRQAETPSGNLLPEEWMPAADVIAAIAKLGAGDGLVERATAALEGVTPGKPCQFHPSYCEEAKGAPFAEWDSSHDLSVILPDGKRYKIGHFRHSADAGFDQFARQWVPEAAAHIAALTAQLAEKEEQLVSVLRREAATHERHDAKMEAAQAEREALTAERNEALESVTNNNDWFGMHCTLWVWLITQPDMPQLDDLEDGGADEVARNYERAITALVDARTADLSAKVARLEEESERWKRAFAAQSNKLQRALDIPGVRAALTDGGSNG